jgi:hypothetical protein
MKVASMQSSSGLMFRRHSKALPARPQRGKGEAGSVFQRLLQFADGALEDRNLRHRITRTFQFRPDLILEV